MKDLIAWLLVPLELFVATLIIAGLCNFIYDTWKETEDMLHDTGKY